MVEQVSQAARAGFVITGFLVGEQQPGILGAPFGGGQSPLGIEQNGAGMRRQDFGDCHFEFFQFLVAGVGAEGFLQGAALVHGSGGDDCGQGRINASAQADDHLPEAAFVHVIARS